MSDICDILDLGILLLGLLPSGLLLVTTGASGGFLKLLEEELLKLLLGEEVNVGNL